MANVLIEESTLTAIADVLREKGGNTTTYKPAEMPNAILAIIEEAALPEVALIVSGECDYKFYNNQWNWYINHYKEKIITEGITNADYMFYDSIELTEIPFDLNISSDCHTFQNLFANCYLLTSVPMIKGSMTTPTSSYGCVTLENMFSHCHNLQEISYDYFTSFGSDEFWAANGEYSRTISAIFFNCYSLKELPDISMIKTKTTTTSYSLYYNMCTSCYVLNGIVDLPVLDTSTFTSNAFNKTFNACSRLKGFTFALDEEGMPVAVNWKNQTIDLSSYVGYASQEANVTGYNSGLTEATRVIDDATYQALKDDADSWTTDILYSRYNHDSVVDTINSLPDTSEYLATQSSGTNTIKFKGSAGASTDGGAISTLTEEEIAVATAKGWTVSIV